MPEEIKNGPTAAENMTSALERIAHKKLVLLILTLMYLAKAQAHPVYLLLAGCIGTIAIVAIDIIEIRKGETK